MILDILYYNCGVFIYICQVIELWSNQNLIAYLSTYYSTLFSTTFLKLIRIRIRYYIYYIMYIVINTIEISFLLCGRRLYDGTTLTHSYKSSFTYSLPTDAAPPRRALPHHIVLIYSVTHKHCLLYSALLLLQQLKRYLYIYIFDKKKKLFAYTIYIQLLLLTYMYGAGQLLAALRVAAHQCETL